MASNLNKLVRYFEGEYLPIDNIAPRAPPPFPLRHRTQELAVSGTLKGATASAQIYSLIETEGQQAELMERLPQSANCKTPKPYCNGPARCGCNDSVLSHQ